MADTTETTELIHQSIKNRQIACGADIATVKYTPYCAQVTCPECLKWQEKVVDAVFAPLTDDNPQH